MVISVRVSGGWTVTADALSLLREVFYGMQRNGSLASTVDTTSRVQEDLCGSKIQMRGENTTM